MTAAAALGDVNVRFPGAYVERKGLALALHHRGLPASRVAALRRLAKRVAARAGLAILPGKEVWDLVPREHRGKSGAVRLIRDHLGKRLGGRAPFTVYAGDDVTDDEALRSLRMRDLGVQIGGVRRAAHYRLRGVRDMHALLRWIAETTTASTTPVPRPRRSGGPGARGNPGGDG